MAFLTKEIADALCTVIALGFSVFERDRRGSVIYEYDDLKDEAEYEKVREFFGLYNVPVTVQMSPSQTLMPYVLGTDLPLDQRQKFIDKLPRHSYRIGEMMKYAAKKGDPKGAYIGIAFMVDASTGNPVEDDPFVYGPSALRQYTAYYRQAGDASVEAAYEEAKKNTNAAVAVVAGNEDEPDVTVPFNDPYVQWKLFESCHGMIRVMAAHPKITEDGTTVYAELALGAGTKKVSSCLPCAMFMASFGKPASSIHLGRGDNWGLPDEVSDEARAAWEKSIVENYEKGISLFNPVVPFNNGTPSFDNYIKNQICQNPAMFNAELPAIFLEALTFESPFSAKIISTCRAGFQILPALNA